jgi:SAM-dependent methyltransferase
MTGQLHEERMAAVMAAVRAGAPARVLDLGCGDGDMLVRLAAEPCIAALVGLDIDEGALARARARLARVAAAGRVDLRLGSMLAPPDDLVGWDCAVLVETIEHIEPGQLSRLERALFSRPRPARVVLTTPNAEFNRLLGVPARRRRHPDHRFEWTRAQFRTWCARAVRGRGFDVTITDIAGAHPDLGGASQMAVFTRA